MSQSAARKPTNISLSTELVARARDLRINMSQAAEGGIAKAVAEEEARLWKIENREAIESWNRYIEENGLPLEAYRQF